MMSLTVTSPIPSQHRRHLRRQQRADLAAVRERCEKQACEESGAESACAAPAPEQFCPAGEARAAAPLEPRSGVSMTFSIGGQPERRDRMQVGNRGKVTRSLSRSS
jgi:hypothetical protein